MRAQAALLEAIVASLILIAAGTAMAMAAYSASFSTARGSIDMRNAEFDIESIAYSGTRLGMCMKGANVSCIYDMQESMNKHYNLGYSSLQIGNLSIDSGNYLKCRSSDHYCFPLEEGQSYTQVCEYLCAG